MDYLSNGTKKVAASEGSTRFLCVLTDRGLLLKYSACD